MSRSYQSWAEVKAELMEDPEFSQEWEETEPFARISSEMIRIRTEQNLTQRDLAERLGTSVSAISRLESYRYRGMKLETLLKVAKALGMRLEIHFEKAS